MSDAKSYPMPMVTGMFYLKRDAPGSQSDAAHMRKVPYCQAIGSIMYSMLLLPLAPILLSLSHYSHNFSITWGRHTGKQ